MTKHTSPQPRAAAWLAIPFALALALASAMPAAAQSIAPRQPSAPFAIDHRVFDGTMKGLLPGNEIVLATKLGNAAWTSFFHPLSAGAVKDYLASPASIPVVAVGDILHVTTALYAPNYRTLADAFPAGSEITLPIVTFGPGNTGHVDGFALLRVIRIQGTGDPKYVHATIVGLELTDAPLAANP